MALVLSAPIGVSEGEERICVKRKIHKCLEGGIGFAGEGYPFLCGAFNVSYCMFGGSDVTV